MSTELSSDQWDMIESITTQSQNLAKEFHADQTANDHYVAAIKRNMAKWTGKVLHDQLHVGHSRKATAEEVLAQSMSALSEAERHRFVLTNLLEALKNGAKLSSIIPRYNEIGLTDIPIDPLPARIMARPDVSVDDEKPAGVILGALGKLGSFCKPLINRAIVAIKAIPDRLKIKIRPVIGAASIIPTLAFVLEGELKLNELWEVVKAMTTHSEKMTV